MFEDVTSAFSTHFPFLIIAFGIKKKTKIPGFWGHSLGEAGWNPSTLHRSSRQRGSWEAGNYRRAGLFDFSGMSIVFVVQGDVPAEDYLCRCGTAYFRKLLCI